MKEARRRSPTPFDLPTRSANHRQRGRGHQPDRGGRHAVQVWEHQQRAGRGGAAQHRAGVVVVGGAGGCRAGFLGPVLL